MKKGSYNVAIVGATGLVGQEMLKILEERNFPVGSLTLLASERSAGSVFSFKGKSVKVSLLSDATFEGIDIGLFSPGASVSAVYAPKAASKGCVVIDNTSQFRMDKDVPLVVPEVNPLAIEGYKKKGIIANPNCSTIQALVALGGIYKAFGLEKILVSSYQAASGAGARNMRELIKQMGAIHDDVESLVDDPATGILEISPRRSPTSDNYRSSESVQCLECRETMR